jgi:hypothetical protein
MRLSLWLLEFLIESTSFYSAVNMLFQAIFTGKVMCKFFLSFFLLETIIIRIFQAEQPESYADDLP